MSIREEFEKAAQEVMNLTKKPDNDTLLALYALYKQGTDGDVQGARPGMLDIKGRKKFDAWAQRRGMAGEKAMQEYVALVGRLKSS